MRIHRILKAGIAAAVLCLASLAPPPAQAALGDAQWCPKFNTPFR
jgi:hypothetical protein